MGNAPIAAPLPLIPFAAPLGAGYGGARGFRSKQFKVSNPIKTPQQIRMLKPPTMRGFVKLKSHKKTVKKRRRK
jgi:hypothetical protein